MDSWREDIMEFLDSPKDTVLNENSLGTSSYVSSTMNSPYFWGVLYYIIPLKRNLDLKGNDKRAIKRGERLYARQFYVGQRVIGISSADHKEHIGKILGFRWSDSRPGVINFVIILDLDTQTQIRLIPGTIKHVIPPITARGHKNKKFDFNKILKEAEQPLQEDDDFDMAVDEEMYREEILEKYPIPDEIRDYLDRKFSGNCYKRNYIELRHMPINILNLMGATTRDTSINDTIERLLAVYAQMTRQITDNLSIIVNLHFIVPDYCKDVPKIRSWADLYLLILAIKRIWRSNRWSGNYQPANPRVNFNWNKDTYNETYLEKMVEAIVLTIKLQLPEEKIDSDGKITTTFSLKP